MDPSEKTMFEIYRGGDYDRTFRCIYYTDLEEHQRDKEVAKAAAGQPVFSGYLDDATKEDARGAIESILDDLNEGDDDEVVLSNSQIRARLSAFLVE